MKRNEEKILKITRADYDQMKEAIARKDLRSVGLWLATCAAVYFHGEALPADLPDEVRRAVLATLERNGISEEEIKRNERSKRSVFAAEKG